jgi:DNA topoisomerase-1
VAHKLVIVESPGKISKIRDYLGKGYVVESSIGHIRDLPQERCRHSCQDQGQAVGPPGCRRRQRLHALLRRPRTRSAHIAQTQEAWSRTPTNSTSPPMRTARVRPSPGTCSTNSSPRTCRSTGWSSTRSPSPRSSRRSRTRARSTMDLVEAQEARRILDRLYGYEVSPVLWKQGDVRTLGRSGAVGGDPTGGRPRARADEVPGRLLLGPATAPSTRATKHDPRMFPAKLHSIDGSRVARGSDFDNTASSSPQSKRAPLQAACRGTGALWATRPYDVRSVESKPYRRSPYAPFRTTTMQQEASRKLGMSAQTTMSVAQRLYENGLHHLYAYGLDDALGAAIAAARDQVRELYGAEYLPDAPRTYASKVKNAQEAHEAIRPAGDSFQYAGADRPDRRAVPPLRADLDAHRRLADEGRDRQLRHRPPGWRSLRRSRRGVLREWSHDHLPRLPQGLRRGHRRRLQARRRRRDPAARPGARARRCRPRR